jgi:hypothetical protein
MANRGQYRLKRRIATVPVTAGGFATIDLPRGYDYESLFLRITGGLQVTAAATSVRAEAPCQSVQRVEVIIDGRTNAFSAPFWYTAFGQLGRALTDNGARVTTPPSGTAIATYQVEAIGVVDFAYTEGERPKDSNLRTTGFSLFQARLSFGNPGDNFVGGTVVYNNLNVEVWSAEVVEMPDAEGKFTTPWALRKVSFQELAVPTSNANQEVRLPAGNLISKVTCRTEGNVTAGEPSITMLNALQLASGVDVRLSLTGPQIRATNNADYGAALAGYYVADVLSRGRSARSLTECWDVRGQAEPKAILDIVGGANNRAQLVVEEFIPAA